MYLVFTCVPGDCYRWRFRSLLLCPLFFVWRLSSAINSLCVLNQQTNVCHRGHPFLRMHFWWSLYTLYLLARQVELAKAIQVFNCCCVPSLSNAFIFLCLLSLHKRSRPDSVSDPFVCCGYKQNTHTRTHTHTHTHARARARAHRQKRKRRRRKEKEIHSALRLVS